MRVAPAVVFLATTIFLPEVSPQQHALFVRKDAIRNGKRVTRQTSADQMVQNILHWLQEVYYQNTRKIRQGSLREYLPPVQTQKPRPFEPPTPSPSEENVIQGGYPPAGSITPQPPFSENSPLPTEISPPLPGVEVTGSASNTGYPEIIPGEASSTEIPSTGYPSGGPSTGYPSGGPTTGYPSGGPTTGYPSGGPSTESPGGGQSTGYPSGGPTAGAPSETPTTGGGGGGGESTEVPFTSATSSGQNTVPTQGPSSPAPFQTTTSAESEEGGGNTEKSEQEVSGGAAEASSEAPEEETPSETQSPDENVIPSESSEKSESNEDDDKHPPHIHSLDVECSKEMMTINLEFNREFNGIIYSKGYYNNPDCRYVQENSGQKKYTFTVSLNSCGTEFVSAFETQGQSYLENVLVLQNEAGIQEVWDTVRQVRCLWEGNLKKALNLTLSVGMLNQEIVTFSGDTAMARLDIQMGKGPFAPPASGLIKIGEVMTLVVSVTGDPDFDVQVKDCRAVDTSGENVVALTDEKGCVLKPKLFGAFQKTRETRDTGASIIAYAYFNAFKFPDIMDLTIECNVDLCKVNCEICTEPNQKTEPGRKRRDIRYYQNRTENDESVTMGKSLRVILPEDLGENSALINIKYNEGICLSTEGFVVSSALLITLLCCSCLFSAVVWLKYQSVSHKK